VKHAEGVEFSIHLQYLPGELILYIRDNGIGLKDPGSNGAGMINMRKRAELLGGSFEARDEDKGTSITVRIPVMNNKV
jgi:signal transduction histidine kinase